LVSVWWGQRFLGSNKAMGWCHNLSHSIQLKNTNCSSKVEQLETIQENRALEHDEILDLLD
jgi:hypothetical protein